VIQEIDKILRDIGGTVRAGQFEDSELDRPG